MTTTAELVTAGSDRLQAAGSDTPRLDAELLLAHAIGVDRTAVIAHGGAPVGPDAEATYQAFVARREAGEPIAYIRGFKEFHGLVLGTDPRALIPRPETEGLVDLALREIMRRLLAAPAPSTAARLRVIDVGTGSGAIAIALAADLRRRGVPPSELALMAVDISPDALDLARENAVGHGVADRVAFVGADLLPPTSMSDPWDVVVANLPYIASGALPDLPVATSYEPVIALDGGRDGLEAIRRLLERLPTGLAIDGVVLLEIGADQGERIVELTGERLPGWACRVEPDLAGLPRVAVIERGSS